MLPERITIPDRTSFIFHQQIITLSKAPSIPTTPAHRRFPQKYPSQNTIYSSKKGGFYAKMLYPLSPHPKKIDSSLTFDSTSPLPINIHTAPTYNDRTSNPTSAISSLNEIQKNKIMDFNTPINSVTNNSSPQKRLKNNYLSSKRQNSIFRPPVLQPIIRPSSHFQRNTKISNDDLISHDSKLPLLPTSDSRQDLIPIFDIKKNQKGHKKSIDTDDTSPPGDTDIQDTMKDLDITSGPNPPEQQINLLGKFPHPSHGELIEPCWFGKPLSTNHFTFSQISSIS